MSAGIARWRRRWRGALARVWRRVGEDHLSIIAAGVAFYGVFAIFPGVAALIAAYGFVADPADIRGMLQAIEPLLPSGVYGVIAGQVEEILAAGSGVLGMTGLVSLGVALWLARAGVMALIEGLNIVYDERDPRGLVAQYVWALLLTTLLVLFAVVVLLAVVAMPVVLRFGDLGGIGVLLGRVAPLLVLGLAMVFVIGGLYRFGPHRVATRKRWVTVGATAATFGWMIVSFGLSIYMSSFADFNKTYGSLGAIVGLMFWMWASVFVVLLGAELNAALEAEDRRERASGR